VLFFSLFWILPIFVLSVDVSCVKRTVLNVGILNCLVETEAFDGGILVMTSNNQNTTAIDKKIFFAQQIQN